MSERPFESFLAEIKDARVDSSTEAERSVRQHDNKNNGLVVRYIDVIKLLSVQKDQL